MTSTIDSESHAPLALLQHPARGAVDASRLAHPSSWRERVTRAIASERAHLESLPSIRSLEIVVEGRPDALVLRITCVTASEIVPLAVMREIDGELPARLEAAAMQPFVERHVSLAIGQGVVAA